MWEALEQTPWVKTLGTTGWMYASVSVMHYLTMFWFIGSFAIVDLRVMGVAVRKRNVDELAQQFLPWAWMGFAVAVFSGFLMFATDAGDWAPDKVFHVKLMLIVLSVVFAIIVHRGAAKWGQAPEIPTSAKIIATISLLLWIVTIISASEIPALEGLG
jgi:amino acid transporter